MLRSITVAVAIAVVGLALALASMVAVDGTSASAPVEKTFPEGSVCLLIYQPRNSEDVVALFGPGIPTFTVRWHDGWDQISFEGNNATIPIEGAVWKTCPIFPLPLPVPLPGVT